MAENTKRSWGWAILFGALTASNVVQLLLGTASGLATTLVAVGFAGMALAALYKPSGFVSVSWRQVRSPSKLRGRELAGVAGAALLVIGTAMQWSKI
jgi:hypothetical protein